jgi:hypothetical protein
MHLSRQAVVENGRRLQPQTKQGTIAYAIAYTNMHRVVQGVVPALQSQTLFTGSRSSKRLGQLVNSDVRVVEILEQEGCTLKSKFLRGACVTNNVFCGRGVFGVLMGGCGRVRCLVHSWTILVTFES